MSANDDLERRIADFYASEARLRAPDRVLGEALATIESTPQRRALIRVPWRFPKMNTYARLAVAAVAVILVGAVGLAVLRPGPASNVGGSPSPSPTPSATPSLSPSPSPSPSASPALTETFTSAIHGISISYPAGWTARPATEPWTIGIPFQGSAFADVISESPARNVFLLVASQPLAARSDDQWVAEISSASEWGDTCDPKAEPIAIDRVSGVTVVHCDGTPTALASQADRGYLIVLYGVENPMAWFKEILATVQLHPADAVDVSPSPSP